MKDYQKTKKSVAEQGVWVPPFFRRFIKDAGFKPLQRNALYQVLRRFD
jgi:hypothetical protein